MGAGESYEQNVRRELEEEMGIKPKPKENRLTGTEGGIAGERLEGEVRRCFAFHYKDERTNVWGDVWDCVWGGEIVPQPVSCRYC